MAKTSEQSVQQELQELRARVRELERAAGDREAAVISRQEVEERVHAEQSRYEQGSTRLREQEAGIKEIYRKRDQVKNQRMETELESSQLKLQWEGRTKVSWESAPKST